MEIAKQIGKIIQNQRTKKHYTQEHVAEALGLKQSTYANYESGNRLLPAKYVSELSQKLRFDVSEINQLHPKISVNYIPMYTDDDHVIVIQSDSVATATPVNPAISINPIVPYMASQGYDFSISEPEADYLYVKTTDYELGLSRDEINELNKNVKDYIEFELYKKRNR